MMGREEEEEEEEEEGDGRLLGPQEHLHNNSAVTYTLIFVSSSACLWTLPLPTAAAAAPWQSIRHTWAGFTYSCICDEGFILS